jgi:hypothetical protein
MEWVAFVTAGLSGWVWNILCMAGVQVWLIGYAELILGCGLIGFWFGLLHSSQWSRFSYFTIKFGIFGFLLAFYNII